LFEYPIYLRVLEEQRIELAILSVMDYHSIGISYEDDEEDVRDALRGQLMAMFAERSLRLATLFITCNQSVSVDWPRPFDFLSRMADHQHWISSLTILLPRGDSERSSKLQGLLVAIVRRQVRGIERLELYDVGTPWTMNILDALHRQRRPLRHAIFHACDFTGYNLREWFEPLVGQLRCKFDNCKGVDDGELAKIEQFMGSEFEWTVQNI
jgi:hypothetical protein